MRKLISIISIIFVICFGTNVSAEDYNFDKLISSMEESFRKIKDYTCIMHKKELIDKDYITSNNIILKYKKPDNYYLKFTEGPNEGMEVIYAGKKYDYKMLVHLGGILNVKNMKLDPKGSMALKKNRHAVTESDMGYMISLVKSNFAKSKSKGEGSLMYFGETKLNGREVIHLKAEFPKGKGYYGKKIELFVDKQYNLPAKLVVYGWDDKLLEMYQITKLKIDTGLTDKDFDEDNPAYGF